jgi:ethanolamine ammonia-lyase large subunit
MVTLEARAYGVARHVHRTLDVMRGDSAPRWMIVNDVAGFIGPEVFATAGQLERACLEDTVMGKLHGLTMGLDICSTFHMGITPRDLRALTQRIAVSAAPAYLMAVAGAADPMLGYMTTAFREHPRLRSHVRRGMTTAMGQRLRSLGVMSVEGEASGPAAVERLYAIYERAGGDHRTFADLEDEGSRRLSALRDKGFDLGVINTIDADRRIDTLYTHARAALYASIQDAVVRDATARSIRVRTTARDRDDYLAHPTSGEHLSSDDALAIARLIHERSPHVQIVVSDGLNANAINEQLRAVLPPLRGRLIAAGHHVADTDIIVKNGRVRIGYEIGGVVNADVIVHLIGERPGTGLNTASAYITYGRDESGGSRWSRSLDHSATTAICGVHPAGKPPAAAIEEIATVVTRALREKRSGIG